MNIEQLEYILAIDKYGSMSVAGEKLHVSQQGISAAIKNLEAEVGTMLVNRTSKGSSLTLAGKGVARFADGALTGWKALVDDFHRSKERFGSIKDIQIVTMSMMNVAKLESFLRNAAPEVRIKVTLSFDSSEVVDLVSSAQNGIGFIMCTEDALEMIPESLNPHIMQKFHPSINASKRNPLTRTRPFRLGNLKGQTVFIPFQKNGDDGGLLQELIDRYDLEKSNSVVYGSSPVFYNDLIQIDAGVSLQMIGAAPIDDSHPDIVHLVDDSETFYYAVISNRKDLLSLTVGVLE